MASIMTRFKTAWNAFTYDDETPIEHREYTSTYSHRPDRSRSFFVNERSIITSIYTRLAIDVASIDLRHVRVDEQGRYERDMNSAFNKCLTLEANIDQAARAFRQDLAMTLFEKGVAVIVPVDTTTNPNWSDGFDIHTMRVGEIVSWHPQHVRVSVYNERVGERQELVLHKAFVGVVENPLYRIMNEPNSTLQRLIRKLSLLDTVDEASSSGKLDLIIQLPYVIKSEARRQQAEQRRKDIEFQLKGSQYGIAYTDGTEKITQLNRPVENSLLKQIETLTGDLYAQLGLTTDILNGTANEQTMLNYHARTIKPVLDAIVESMRRSFLSPTARTQNQTVMYFRDAFSLVPIASIAEIGDKFTRNEILTANEMRQVIGFMPSDDPNADKLRNSNMPDPDAGKAPVQVEEGNSQNGSI